MELIRGLHNLKPRHRGCVATIGNFDGVHRGHQAVIGQLLEKARELRLPALVMLFEPQPQEFFQRDAPPPRLARFREKLELLRQSGVDRILCLRFDARLAALTAEEFIERVLVGGLQVRYLAVGKDFQFGHRRRGNFALLAAAGRARGFEVTAVPAFRLGAQRVSSTAIRQALAAGDLILAERMLGRPYAIEGRVVFGDRRGRTLGFPTANIPLRRRTSPLRGVYVVEVHGLDSAPVKGVANVGTRPTVGAARALVEVHLFDFDQDIYRRQVKVVFLHKLRNERRFDSLAELQRQIGYDVAQARAWVRS